MTAATASGIAPRWTGMCSACAIIRPRSSNSAVEQSRRSLIFAENEERIRTAPISSAIDRSDAPTTCSSIGAMTSLTRHDPAGTIPNPLPPGGNPQGRPVQLDQGRTGRALLLAARQLQLRARHDLGGADGHQLDLPSLVGVAVPLVVSAVEAVGELVPERDGQLEGLALVAKVRLALGRQVAHLSER